MENFITSVMSASRVTTSGGQITDLSTAFNVSNGDIPFSLFIIPISTGSSVDEKTVIVNCKCLKNETLINTPFTTFCWDVPLVKEISINGIDLSLFDVYWGTGR